MCQKAASHNYDPAKQGGMGTAETEQVGTDAGREKRRSGAVPYWLAAIAAGGLLFGGPVPLRAQSPVVAQPEEIARPGALTVADLSAAFGQLDDLGAFFSAFAAQEANGLAQDRWRRRGANYRDTAVRLRALQDKGDLVIGDLDGHKTAPLPDESRDAQLRDRLLPVLMQILARRSAPQDWPWLADHLQAAGGLTALAETEHGRALLARFFQAKDAYLWLTVQRVAQGDPARRLRVARRQAATFETIRGLRGDMVALWGAAPAERLQRDWTGYVAEVDGYAATRGWLLLDPALQQTQLGAATKADAVDLAAARIVAEAPRAATAARKAELAALRDEVAALRSRVGSLEQALPARSAEAQAEHDALAEQLRAAQLPPTLTVVPPARGAEDASALALVEQRQFLIIVGLILTLLLALLWWWRGRRGAPRREAEAVTVASRLDPSGQDDVIAASPEASIDLPKVPSGVVPPVEEKKGPAGYTPPPKHARIRVSGVEPPTAQARAAMRAGEVKARAVRAAMPSPESPAEVCQGLSGESQAVPSGGEAAAVARPIVQALRQGNLPLFELLFGELTGLRAPQLQRVVYGGHGEDLLVVCRAIGVEKLLFGSIFLLTDPLRGGDANEDSARAEEVLRMYDRLPAAIAREVLRKWQQKWGYDVLSSGQSRAGEMTLG